MEDDQLSWQHSLQNFQARLDQAGLGDLARLVAEVMQPFGPALAQLLWFGQPLLGLFDQYQAAGDFAEYLTQWGLSAGETDSDG